MKKLFTVALLVLGILTLRAVAQPVLAQPEPGISELAQTGARHILDFFRSQGRIYAAVVDLVDLSGLSDLSGQKFYQLLVAGLESDTSGHIRFSDLMIAFAANRGEFNLNPARPLSHLIQLKLIRNRDRIGLGIVIFSRTLNRIVYIKYLESPLSAGEQTILQSRDLPFSGLGFTRLIEMEVRENLLAVRNIRDDSGEERYFFYYPDELLIYKINQERLEKFFSIKLNWQRPLYPVLDIEGKLALFTRGQTLWLSVGGNFSPRSQLFQLKGGQWEAAGTVDFVPLRRLVINHVEYLAGARFEAGKNVFSDRLVLAPFREDRPDPANVLEKQGAPSFDLDFSSADGQLNAIHAVDTTYHCRLLSAAFEETFAETVKYGASLAVAGDRWLAVSDYSETTDRLHIFDISGGGRLPVYQAPLEGEATFICEGSWKGTPGFWVGVRKKEESYWRPLLQFWGKKDE